MTTEDNSSPSKRASVTKSAMKPPLYQSAGLLKPNASVAFWLVWLEALGAVAAPEFFKLLVRSDMMLTPEVFFAAAKVYLTPAIMIIVIRQAVPC
ncbi:hypothetical protein VIBNISFn118_250020 [Vibrio nigripulchritudo SFn118]|nr:hypothetical protein VIBNISFn118_250020 [Vibrio nigripulchritudo SFn118]